MHLTINGHTEQWQRNKLTVEYTNQTHSINDVTHKQIKGRENSKVEYAIKLKDLGGYKWQRN